MNGTLIVAGMIGVIGIVVVIAQLRGNGDAEGPDADMADQVTMTSDHDTGEIDDL